MFKTIKNAWSIPDLRKKILFTLLIIVVFRFGATIPVPFLDVDALQGLMGTVNETGNALSYLDMLSGGAFANATMRKGARELRPLHVTSQLLWA